MHPPRPALVLKMGVYLGGKGPRRSQNRPLPSQLPCCPSPGQPRLGALPGNDSFLPPQAPGPSSAAPSSSADTALSVLGLPWPARGALSGLGLALDTCLTGELWPGQTLLRVVSQGPQPAVPTFNPCEGNAKVPAGRVGRLG